MLDPRRVGAASPEAARRRSLWVTFRSNDQTTRASNDLSVSNDPNDPNEPNDPNVSND
jgi:hypothetical protein